MYFKGYGNLSLSIEGPSKADMDCEDNEDNTCRVAYRPTEPGNYVLSIKFGEEHIPGQWKSLCNLKSYLCSNLVDVTFRPNHSDCVILKGDLMSTEVYFILFILTDYSYHKKIIH